MKKKKLPVWLKIVLVVLGVVILAVGGVFAYAQITLNKIQRSEADTITKVDPKDETFDIDENYTANSYAPEMDPSDITWPSDITKMQNDSVKNILLIGQDRREGEERQRSDTMIVISINKKTNKIIMSSIMRDTYVQIPGYSDNRINAAYQFGGMPLLDEVIETNFGLHIDGNVEVDFDGFIKAVDTVGTIDIDLTQEEADYLCKRDVWGVQSYLGNTEWNLQGGVNALTGEQALAYARLRYVGNSDWERTDRQRRVLSALWNKVKSEGVGRILEMMDQILPSMTTDLTNSEIMGYAYTVMTMGVNSFDSYRYPMEGTYQCATLYAGMEVLIPDLQANQDYMRQYIYGE